MLYLQLTHTKPLMLLLLIHSVCLSVNVTVLSYCTTQSDEEEEEERRECVSRSWSTWLTNFLTSSKFWGRTLLEPSISSTRSMLPDLQAERGEPRGGARVWRFLLIWWSHYLTSHWLMLKVWRRAARLIVKKPLLFRFRRTAISFLNADDSDLTSIRIWVFFCRLPLVDCKGHKGPKSQQSLCLKFSCHSKLQGCTFIGV